MYDGSGYSGWQIQPNAITVQEQIEVALSKILRQKTVVMGCGRTDAGVHALQYFLHFDFENVPGNNFLFRLNQILPKDIAALELKQVADDFHARFDAKQRTYIYKIHFQKNPFLVNRSLILLHKPDIGIMETCAKILTEYNDFAAFCKSGTDTKTTICRLSSAEWLTTNEGIEFHISADRFLRNMVRAIVGTLLKAGNGKLSPEEFRKIIESKDRKRSGKSAAACGLYLTEIKY